MQTSIQHPNADRPMPTDANEVAPRLRTVTGNRFPRKCSCGCGLHIPRDPEVRYVVDFGTTKPYPAYLREHSPDYGTYNGGRVRKLEGDFGRVPGFKTGTEILLESAATREREVAHEEPESTASPEAGRPWASGQLVFNAGQFESARSGFADYVKNGEISVGLDTRFYSRYRRRWPR